MFGGLFDFLIFRAVWCFLIVWILFAFGFVMLFRFVLDCGFWFLVGLVSIILVCLIRLGFGVGRFSCY